MWCVLVKCTCFLYFEMTEEVRDLLSRSQQLAAQTQHLADWCTTTHTLTLPVIPTKRSARPIPQSLRASRRRQELGRQQLTALEGALSVVQAGNCAEQQARLRAWLVEAEAIGRGALQCIWPQQALLGLEMTARYSLAAQEQSVRHSCLAPLHSLYRHIHRESVTRAQLQWEESVQRPDANKHYPKKIKPNPF
eukprot:NODE_4369_length_799_cov_29.754464_g4211_i0.p1 GENE.NODE_4369_length_799_cov_29.754464_g4211_i0~~NODE_4369_length_799_cov_29.754464_g4211_i0.p1  ORF type:complete len:205 (-),score=48.78 NODE_4369_length_799_cov_29.754464_g4211_i0:183-761(-)